MGRVSDSPNIGFHPSETGKWRIYYGHGASLGQPAVHISTGDIDRETFLRVLELVRLGAGWSDVVGAMMTCPTSCALQFSNELPQHQRAFVLERLLHQSYHPTPFN